jgi:transcriptional regulator with XRE-family HTH domain
VPRAKDKRFPAIWKIVWRNLGVVRRHRGMSQDDAAKAAKLKADAIRGYEQGKRVPDIGTLKVLADAYGTSVGDFFLDPLPPHMMKHEKDVESVSSPERDVPRQAGAER